MQKLLIILDCPKTIFLFKISMGTKNQYFEISRQSEHAPSKTFTPPVLDRTSDTKTTRSILKLEEVNTSFALYKDRLQLKFSNSQLKPMDPPLFYC